MYKTEAENQLERKLKILRSDRRGLYTSNNMPEYCQEQDIIHEVTTPYIPQSNGEAKLENRTPMDTVNCMLLSSGAPENLWIQLSFLPVSFLIEFSKETLMLVPMNVRKGELLTFNSSKSEVTWLRFQYQTRPPNH